MDAGNLSVEQLRELWSPEKDRLKSLTENHPNLVRFHRSLSWLEKSRQLEPELHGDVILILQWTSLNALYGQWDEQEGMPQQDRKSWLCFVERILELDSEKLLLQLVQQHRGLVLKLVEGYWLNRKFWGDPSQESRNLCVLQRKEAAIKLNNQDLGSVLPQLLDRIYVMRSQMVHGAATCGSKLNRKSLESCLAMMDHLLPVILKIWTQSGGKEDWGVMCYPPMSDGMQPVSLLG